MEERQETPRPPARQSGHASGEKQGAAVNSADAHFIVLRYLQQGPCAQAARVLEREMAQHGLIPAQGDVPQWPHVDPSLSVRYGLQSLLSRALQSVRKEEGTSTTLVEVRKTRGIRLRRRKTTHELPPPRDHRPPSSADRVVFGRAGQPHSILLETLSQQLRGRSCVLQRSVAGMAQRLRKIQTGMHHLQAVTSMACDGKMKRIFTGGDDHLVRVWDAASHREVATLKGHRGAITSIVVSSDGAVLASADHNREGSCIFLWKGEMYERVGEIDIHAAAISTMRFLSGRRWEGMGLLSIDAAGLALVSSVATGGNKAEIQLGRAVSTFCTDSLVGVGHNDGTASILSVVDAYEGFSPIVSMNIHGDSITAISFDHSGRRVLTACRKGLVCVSALQYRRGVVHSWSSLIKISIDSRGFDSIRNAEWVGSDDYVMLLASDGTLNILDVRLGHVAMRWAPVFKVRMFGVGSVIRHPFCRNIAMTLSGDDCVRVWNVPQKSLITELSVFPSCIQCGIWLRNDGLKLAGAGSDGKVYILDVPLITEAKDIEKGGLSAPSTPRLAHPAASNSLSQAGHSIPGRQSRPPVEKSKEEIQELESDYHEAMRALMQISQKGKKPHNSTETAKPGNDGKPVEQDENTPARPKSGSETAAEPLIDVPPVRRRRNSLKDIASLSSSKGVNQSQASVLSTSGASGLSGVPSEEDDGVAVARTPILSEDEQRFYEAIYYYGRDWDKIAEHMGPHFHKNHVRTRAQRWLVALWVGGFSLPNAMVKSGEGFTLSGNPLNPEGGATLKFGGKLYKNWVMSRKEQGLPLVRPKPEDGLAIDAYDHSRAARVHAMYQDGSLKQVINARKAELRATYARRHHNVTNKRPSMRKAASSQSKRLRSENPFAVGSSRVPQQYQYEQWVNTPNLPTSQPSPADESIIYKPPAGPSFSQQVALPMTSNYTSDQPVTSFGMPNVTPSIPFQVSQGFETPSATVPQRLFEDYNQNNLNSFGSVVTTTNDAAMLQNSFPALENDGGKIINNTLAARQYEPGGFNTISEPGTGVEVGSLMNAPQAVGRVSTHELGPSSVEPILPSLPSPRPIVMHPQTSEQRNWLNNPSSSYGVYLPQLGDEVVMFREVFQEMYPNLELPMTDGEMNFVVEGIRVVYQQKYFILLLTLKNETVTVPNLPYSHVDSYLALESWVQNSVMNKFDVGGEVFCLTSSGVIQRGIVTKIFWGGQSRYHTLEVCWQGKENEGTYRVLPWYVMTAHEAHGQKRKDPQLPLGEIQHALTTLTAAMDENWQRIEVPHNKVDIRIDLILKRLQKNFYRSLQQYAADLNTAVTLYEASFGTTQAIFQLRQEVSRLMAVPAGT